MNDFKIKISKLFFRYFIIFLFGIGNLYLFYLILRPLTEKIIMLILSSFSAASIKNGVILFKSQRIELINACLAGSAFYLLFILNLSTPDISLKDRINIMLFSFGSLFLINILRLIILIFLDYSVYFNVSHLISWYFLSTIFVFLIWISSVKFFKIEEIPIYSDIKFILELIKQSKKSKRKKQNYKSCNDYSC
ncbi:MAG: pacearchaeosortase [Nanoarchaeota archaeon]